MANMTNTTRNIPSELPEVEFVDTDTEALVNKLIAGYEEITGRTLYPADPVRAFILWLASVIIQERVNINESAKQNLPRYATGQNLDSLSEIFHNTYRLQPTAASIKCNNDNLNNNTSRSVAYVVMHYTGNSKDTAKANANYFGGAGRNASAHFFVDDAEIYQSVELRDTAWHCGAKSYKHGSCRNANSIGIEMCCTAGNYRISGRTKENAAYLSLHFTGR